MGPVSGFDHYGASLMQPGRGVYLSCPDEDGWTDFDKCGPPQGVLLQFRYVGVGFRYTLLGANYAEDLSPYLNRAGMQWRITGIGKEQLAACEAQL